MAHHGGFICELRHIFGDATRSDRLTKSTRMPDCVTRLTEAN